MKNLLVCNSPGRIDLHIHSTASDGSLTPEQIASLCPSLDIKAFSLTDHDCVDGCRELLYRGLPGNLEFISGVEISADAPDFVGHKGSLHILGYGFDVEDAVLSHELGKLRNARRDRNPAIIQLINRLGFACTLEDVVALSPDGQIGRPHIAQLMQARGWVNSVDEAFDRYLKHGRPAYVDKYRIPCRRAIEMIRGAGGVPFLAHPALIKGLAPSAMEDLIGRLMEWGLMGIEVFYPEHTPVQIEYYLDLASRRGLLVSGGTDFHGDMKPEIRLGVGLGDMCVPYGLFENIRNTAGSAMTVPKEMEDA